MKYPAIVFTPISIGLPVIRTKVSLDGRGSKASSPDSFVDLYVNERSHAGCGPSIQTGFGVSLRLSK